MKQQRVPGGAADGFEIVELSTQVPSPGFIGCK